MFSKGYIWSWPTLRFDFWKLQKLNFIQKIHYFSIFRSNLRVETRLCFRGNNMQRQKQSEFQIAYYFFSHSQAGNRNFRFRKFRRCQLSPLGIFTSAKILGGKISHGENSAHQSNSPKKEKNFLKRTTLHPNFNCFKKFINRNLDFVVDVRLLALSSTLISGI